MSDDVKTIRIKCPSMSCQRVLAVPEHARGKLVRCRQCMTVIRIPQPQAAAETAVDDAAGQ